MISVNQEIGLSVPGKLNNKRRGGRHMMFIIKRETFDCWGEKLKGGIGTMKDTMLMNKKFKNTRQYKKHRNKVKPYQSNVSNDIKTILLVCDTIEWVLYNWNHWLEVG